MHPKRLRAKRAYDRRYRRENIMSWHRDRAYGANRRYGGPKLRAADVAASFAKCASCYYCRAPLDGRTGTLEHIDAALGNNPGNLTVACQSCNRGKHAKPKSAWLKRLATHGDSKSAMVFTSVMAAIISASSFLVKPSAMASKAALSRLIFSSPSGPVLVVRGWSFPASSRE